MCNRILGSIQHPSIHTDKTEELPHRFCIQGTVISVLSLYRLSGFYILTTDCFCLPLRNALPANASPLGTSSAHGNRLLGELAHGECKTVLMSIAAP